MKFYLGTHEISWLRRSECVDVHLFVSARRLRRQKTFKRATTSWALDSGGFTEISKYGEWRTTPAQYADEALRWADQLGAPDFASPQDWMCEPDKLVKTGLSIREHQRRTIESVIRLRELAPSLCWLPVLQGWTFEDYLAHVEQYEHAGFDLQAEPLVGVGTMCTRKATAMPLVLFAALRARGLKCHAFGFSRLGLRRASASLATADSMSWSYAGFKRPNKTHVHPRGGKSCANCIHYALDWRSDVIDDIKTGERQTQHVFGF